MWIISTHGFVSLVEHDEDPAYIRVRARRRKHLLDTFPFVADADVIDYGVNASDYRYHANVPRAIAAEAILNAVMNLHVTSHVKEAVAGNDDVFYRAMLDSWSALRRLQPARPAPDWWTTAGGDDDEDDDLDDFHGSMDATRDDFFDDPPRRRDDEWMRRRGLGMPSRLGSRDAAWGRTPERYRDSRADKPLDELTGGLAAKMMRSAPTLTPAPPPWPLEAPEPDDDPTPARPAAKKAPGKAAGKADKRR